MNKLICVVGPTASGKTEVALELSKLIPVEIISCDSMQVYQEMPILTQTPSKEVLKKVKTHLVSFVKPSQEYSAAKFRKEAGELLPKIIKKNKTPLLVGGTGLYLRALLDGLFEMPEGEASRDEDFRKKLILEQETHGGEYLHEQLAKIDPIAAKKIHANDVRRLVRALEVYHLSGRTISEQKPNRSGIRDDYQVRIFLLERDRQELYARINGRAQQMLDGGLLDEVKRLQKVKMSQTAEMALGFREMSAYFEGKTTLEEALALLRINTRHYAKRQLSWFRHEKGVEAVAVASGEKAAETAKKIIKLMSSPKSFIGDQP